MGGVPLPVPLSEVEEEVHTLAPFIRDFWRRYIVLHPCIDSDRSLMLSETNYLHQTFFASTSQKITLSPSTPALSLSLELYDFGAFSILNKKNYTLGSSAVLQAKKPMAMA